MIELKSVTKSFQSPILENVNLQVPKGDFLYLIGESGAGKTTLLRMIYGDVTPSKGTISVLGQDLNSLDFTKLQMLRRKMGIIFQDLKLIDELNVFDNILLSLDLAFENAPKGSAAVKKTIDEVLQMVGMSKLSKKKAKVLSGGERQRVAIARAIVRKPEILLADEPTAGLEREQTWALMDLLQKFHARGMTILFATHDREIVRRVRRRSCVLKSGRIVLEEGISLL